MEAALPSYIWDWETVAKVSALTVCRKYYVSDEYLLDLRHENQLALIEAREKSVVLVDLQNQIRVHGVEAHPDDVTLTTEQCPTDIFRTMLRITGRWGPQTHEVMLYGGPQDGSTWAVRDAPHKPLVMEQPTARPVDWARGLDAPPLEITAQKTVWQASGWHEQRRCWIYTQDGK